MHVCWLACRAVLLAGPQPRVVLGPSCASWLLEHFRDVDSSASMAQRAMQVRDCRNVVGHDSMLPSIHRKFESVRQLHGCVAELGAASKGDYLVASTSIDASSPPAFEATLQHFNRCATCCLWSYTSHLLCHTGSTFDHHSNRGLADVPVTTLCCSSCLLPVFCSLRASDTTPNSPSAACWRLHR